MYELNDYGRMMADPTRMNAYTEALRRAIEPGDVVVDVGTGTGVFAMLAARFGARKVYAIDTNPCIHLAREVAKRNGVEDRIEFIHKSVFDVELPEKADVLVSDCRGAFPLHGRHPELVFVARDKFLKPGGRVIPLRDELLVSAVECESAHAFLRQGWTTAGFDWEPCRRAVLSSALTGREVELADAKPLIPHTAWASIDYAGGTATVVRGSVSANATAAGTIHFLVLSFRAHLADRLGYRADEIRGVYAPLVLPLEQPLSVGQGEAVGVRIDAFPTAADYMFAWRLRAGAEERRQATDGNPKTSLPLEFPPGTGQPTSPRIP